VKKYFSIFFDLDHTLWDYDKNSKETLAELYAFHNLDRYGHIGFEQFNEAFHKVNLLLWDQHDRGVIDRYVIQKERFPMVFAEFDIVDQEMSDQISKHYYALSPTKKNLIPNALDVLEYLVQRYPLFVITNGFHEMQSGKVFSGGIAKYFKAIVTSEQAGHKKPSREIFDHTLRLSGHQHHEAIMIGDNVLTDIAGAMNAGIDSILYNPKKAKHDAVVTHEIFDLLELRGIL
jgi:YjjG family noncanonical pyrimidine nucleotidase